MSSATRENLPLIAVTLNAPDDWQDHKWMLDHGFANFSVHYLVQEGTYMRTLRYGNRYVGAVAGEHLRVVLRDNEVDMVEFEYEIGEVDLRNLQNGDIIGEVRAVVNRQVMGRAALVARRQGDEGRSGRRRGDSFAEIYSQLWRGLTALR